MTRLLRMLGALLMLSFWAWAQENPKGQQSQSDVGISIEEYLARLPSVSSSLMSPVVPRTGTERIAGEIFGTPVSVDNYYFAKRVAAMFARPWGASDLPEAEREPVIWESLILHYEAFRRGVNATEEELETMINELLRSYDKPFGRRDDPDAYRRWVVETLYEAVELFENQIRYVIQIRKVKDQVLQEQRVTATEEEMQQEFLNEQHHVGGEMVVFDTKEQAQALYEQVKELARRAQGVASEKGYHFDSLYEITETQSADVKTVRNQVEELRQLLEIQRAIIERNMNQPMVKTWFEAR